MKDFKIIWMFCLLGLFACDADIPVIDQTSDIKITNPYLQIVTSNITFQGPIPEYEIIFNVINSDNIYGITKVSMYRVFSNASAGTESDRTLFKEYSLSGGTKETVTDIFTYADLKEGLGLPDDPNELKVGEAQWTFSFEGTQSDGNVTTLSGNIVMAVQGRLAGDYEVLFGSYIHPTAGDQGNNAGAIKTITSIADGVYRFTEIGPFGDNTNGFNFVVNEDNSIFIPTDQFLWGGNDPIATCAHTPGELPDVNCGNSDFVEYKDDGHDIITISYGYTRASGTRQFQDILEKL